MTGIKEACDKVGGLEPMAQLLGISRQAVHQFLKSGYAQLRSALEIEAQTGVDRRRLVDPRLVDLLT